MGFEVAHPLVADPIVVDESAWPRHEAADGLADRFSERPTSRTPVDRKPQPRYRLRRWHGGPAGPADWTGGNVVLRDGSRMPGSAVGYWYHQGDGHDIVAYEAVRSDALVVDTLFWLAVALLLGIAVSVIAAPKSFDLLKVSALIAIGYAMAAPYVLSGRIHADHQGMTGAPATVLPEF